MAHDSADPHHSDTFLQVDNLSKSFRGVRALDDYRLTLRKGDLLGVIGPNGAGKTTLFNLLTGVVKPTGGSIRLHGDNIAGLRPEAIARRHVARTFQKIRLFPALTALENVRVSVQSQGAASLWRTLLSTPAFSASERTIVHRAHELLNRVGIDHLAGESVFRLSYSEQRRLELACALGLEPELLLLDEPTAGMNPTETDTMIDLVSDLQRELHLAIVLIEHNMQVIMNTCRHIQALNYGRIIGEGSPDEIRQDEDVIAAYLGHGRRDDNGNAETPAAQTGP